MFKKVISLINLLRFKNQWRQKNRHNMTVVRNVFEPEKVVVGNYTYGALNILSWGAGNEGLRIGHLVSIADDVRFILGGNHYSEGVFTYPISSRLNNNPINEDVASKGEISIGDNVWIGYGSRILSGVDIGTGSIVAAGAVVTKSFPPYSVIGGNPAKLIKNRFDREVIEELMKLDFANLSKSDLANLDNDFIYRPATLEVVKKIREELNVK